MGVMAFPYTAVLDVTANALLGNNTGSAAAAQALTASQVRTLCSLYSTSEVDTLLAGKASSSHTHGNITNAGAIGSTSGVPIITGTSGVLQAGSFGSTSGTFCQGNDSRLSDSRTPTAHKTTHATGGSDALTAADIGAAATSHTHAASDITSGTIATARLASGTASASTYLRGDQTWATVTAGVGGSTGSVDNILLRSDGTGGSTLQDSSWSVPDIYTASPNATVNHLSLQATGSTTNVSASIVPKGTGAFSLAVPNGAASGGNVRGTNAVDLQTNRSAAANVASGTNSVILGGSNCTASSTNSICGGADSTASGAHAVAIGNYNRATNYAALALGINANASGNQAIAIANANGSIASGDRAVALGSGALANRNAMLAYATGGFSSAEGAGDSQFVRWVLRNKTTDGTTAVTLFANGSSERCSLTSGKILHAMIQLVGSKSDGSAVAVYQRQVAIKNVGGTTSLVGAVNSIGTDTAAGTTIAVTADDTNDALQIAVTGVASETWRWVAVVSGVELAYGT